MNRTEFPVNCTFCVIILSTIVGGNNLLIFHLEGDFSSESNVCRIIEMIETRLNLCMSLVHRASRSTVNDSVTF